MNGSSNATELDMAAGGGIASLLTSSLLFRKLIEDGVITSSQLTNLIDKAVQLVEEMATNEKLSQAMAVQVCCCLDMFRITADLSVAGAVRSERNMD